MKTCCGCGVGVLRVIPGAASGARATFTMSGVHVSCAVGSGGAGTVFTEVLTDYCTGTLADGRRFIEFFGSSANACNGDLANCGNEYRIMAVCGAVCPDPVCDCEGCWDCFDFSGPVSYYSSISGFADDTWNGDWIWTHTGGCTWEADCDGHVSTLTYVPAAGIVPAKWVLSHGGATFELAAASWHCRANIGAPNLMALASGTGPATVSVREAGAVNPLDCFDYPDLVATVTFGDCGTYTFHLTYNPLAPNYQAGETQPTICDCNPTGDEPVTAFIECHSKVLDFTCGGPSGAGAGVYTWAAPMAISSLSPFHATKTGTFTCGGATVAVSVVITE
jgi:hypothetical protein